MDLSVSKDTKANGRDISMSGTFLRKHNNKSSAVHDLHLPPLRSTDDPWPCWWTKMIETWFRITFCSNSTPVKPQPRIFATFSNQRFGALQRAEPSQMTLKELFFGSVFIRPTIIVRRRGFLPFHLWNSVDTPVIAIKLTKSCFLSDSSSSPSFCFPCCAQGNTQLVRKICDDDAFDEVLSTRQEARDQTGCDKGQINHRLCSFRYLSPRAREWIDSWR